MLGYEYLTSNIYTAYPFNEESSGLDWCDDSDIGNSSDKLPVSVIADARFVLPADYSKLWLSAIIKDVGTFQIELLCEDWDGNSSIITSEPISDAVADFESANFRVDLELADVDVIGALVLTDRFKLLLGSMSSELRLGTSVEFSARAVQSRSRRTLSIVSTDSSGVQKHDLISGDVSLIAGYNVALEGIKGTNSLIMSAAPGAGEGYYPCPDCDGTPGFSDTLYRGNHYKIGVNPDQDGAIVIETDACHSAIPGDGVITLEGVCEACCTCDDYVGAANILKRMYDESKEVYDRLRQAHVTYNKAVVASEVSVPQFRRLIVNARATKGIENLCYNQNRPSDESFGEDLPEKVGAHQHGVFYMTLLNFTLNAVTDITITVNDEACTRVYRRGSLEPDDIEVGDGHVLLCRYIGIEAGSKVTWSATWTEEGKDGTKVTKSINDISQEFVEAE
jgi:hypothetical protein